MKLFLVSLFTFTSAVALGNSAESVILAAMRLAEEPNYSWTAAVTDDARSYTIEGRTERHGLTWMRLPLVQAVAQRLGRSAEPDVEAIFAPDGTCVLRTESGWRTWWELPERHRDWRGQTEAWGTPRTLAARRGGSVFVTDPFDPTTLLAPAPLVRDAREPAYSNAQFALSRPHDELALIVSSYTALEVRGDVAVGLLSDLGAQLLLVREGQEDLTPVRAAGAFKLWLKQGRVTRYQVNLQGILLVGRQRVTVNQQSTTELRAIGATHLNLPEEARWRLARAN